MTRRPLDPRMVNVLFDANAFDPRDPLDDGNEVDRLLTLRADGKINLIAPQGVRREVQHPNTPNTIRDVVSSQIFSLPVELNSEELQLRARIYGILKGNAPSDKHAADAQHVFEAAKYGGGYFVTHDCRINHTKRHELEAVLPPSLWIVTLREFLSIYDRYESEHPR